MPHLPAVHPGAALILWCALVVLLQTVSGWGLGTFAGLVLLSAALTSAPTLGRLLRRIRYLLLAIVVLFAWMTPGQAALPFWPEFGPTREGALLALEHGLRLVGVVALVAILLGRGGRDFVVSGLYALMAPAPCLGLSRDRLAVRLLLVLRHAEQPQPAGWRHWLDAEGVPDPGPLHVRRAPLRARDWLAMALAVVLVALSTR